MIEKGSLSVCEWKKFNFLRLKLFEFDLMNQLKSLFRRINKGRKDSCQWGTVLTRVHACFLISLRAPKLLTKKRHCPDSCSRLFSNQPARTKTVNKKSQNKESVFSRSLIKNKLLWYFFHSQSQFLNVTENKPWTLSHLKGILRW